MTHDTNANDPLSDFSVPQDADVVADDPAADPAEGQSGSDTVTEVPSGQAGRVADDPSVKADTPAEAEELAGEQGA
jgi:hypothetical protein